MADFFVSYTKADVAWAEWIAWQVEQAGYQVVIQTWDFLPGQDFVKRMDEAMRNSDRAIAVESPDYLTSVHGPNELYGYYRADPDSMRALILPVQVRPCNAGDAKRLLGGRVRVDLAGVDDESTARALLLDAVHSVQPGPRPSAAPPDPRRRKPQRPPPYPATPRVAASPPVDYSHLKKLKLPLEGVDDELFSIAFSRDGEWLAAGSNRAVLLWNLRHRGEPTRIEGHGSYVYSVSFSYDSQRLATGGEDGYVRVWAVPSRKQLWGQRQHTEAVYSVAFSRSGTRVASGGYDGRVLLWDAARGRALRGGGSAVDGSGRVTSVAFSPNDKLLAIGSLKDTVWLLDIDTGEAQVIGRHESSVEGVAFSPDGRSLASCGLDKAVCVWRIDDAGPRLLWRKREHEYVVRAVAYSPDGRTLASVGWDKRLNLWDADTGALRASLPFKINDRNWHSDWIWSVAFSTEGMLLASSGSDGRVVLWQVASS